MKGNHMPLAEPRALRASQIVRNQEGVALIVAVLLLIVMSAIGLASMDHSGAESEGTARSRRTTVTFHAADAGIQRGFSQVLDNPPLLTAFQGTFADGTAYRSGPRTAASAQPIPSPDVGPPPAGYEINVGSGYTSQVFLNQASSFGPGNATADLEARYSKLEAGVGSGY